MQWRTSHTISIIIGAILWVVLWYLVGSILLLR